MDKNFTNLKTVVPSLQSKVDPYFWDVVFDMYNKKQYADSVRNLISYVDPTLAVTSANEDKTFYQIPHGSANLCIKITEDNFEVKAPFLDISEAKTIPLMRKVAELNFSPLNLSHIKLEDDKLQFYYVCPLELCEPQKIYNVLKEICIFTDSYDDEFINKYNAKWILEPKITNYDTKVLEAIWSNTRLFLEEAINAIAYFESKRQSGSVWDVIAITLMKIEYYAGPQGYIRTELERQLTDLSEEEVLTKKIESGKKFLEKLINYDKNNFLEDIYQSEVFIPYKWRATNETVKSSLKAIYEQAKSEMQINDYVVATLNITYNFYNIFYNNNVSDEYEELISGALIESGNKSWEESSKILFKALEELVGAESEKEESKGLNFFRKLFKRK